MIYASSCIPIMLCLEPHRRPISNQPIAFEVASFNQLKKSKNAEIIGGGGKRRIDFGGFY